MLSGYKTFIVAAIVFLGSVIDILPDISSDEAIGLVQAVLDKIDALGLSAGLTTLRLALKGNGK